MASRPTDDPEYYSLYAVPAAVLLGGFGLLLSAGKTAASSLVALASGVCCIGAIGALGKQVLLPLSNRPLDVLLPLSHPP